MTSIDEQFVEFIVKSLVGNPDEVKIVRTIDEKGVLLELTVSADDLGRVIGKRGATAQSIRTLLRALGTKNDARYNLKIVDVGGPRERSDNYSDRQDHNQRDAQSSEQPTGHDEAEKPHDEAVAQEEKREDFSYEQESNDNQETSEDSSTSNLADKTRKELEELDDLDI